MDQKVIQESVDRIKRIDFQALTLDDYSVQYLASQLPYLDYYYPLYGSCVNYLQFALTSDHYVVDFGGGMGFLSAFLKQLGFRVIYCDNNPLVVRAARKITTAIGSPPDLFVEGSVDELVVACRTRAIVPAFLISVDVIEHVHNLDNLFVQLHNLNPAMQMIFTTICNPMNPYRRFFLDRMMKGVERHYFLPMRLEFICKMEPNMTGDEQQQLARATRGCTYASIKMAIEQYKACGDFPHPCEGNNTCDPNSGSWVERILPLRSYRDTLKAAGFRDISFIPGTYNSNGSTLRRLLLRGINRFILFGRGLALPIAPHIYIIVNKKRSL